MRYMYLLFAALMLNGCVSPSITTEPMPLKKVEVPKGPSLAEIAAKYKKGKTTYSEVIKELGEPLRVTTNNGEKWIDYREDRLTPEGKAKITFLHMRFDEKDVAFVVMVSGM